MQIQKRNGFTHPLGCSVISIFVVLKQDCSIQKTHNNIVGQKVGRQILKQLKLSIQTECQVPDCILFSCSIWV